VASDAVTAAVAELYGNDPQDFTDRRKALAAAARAAGDAEAAKRIAALRKPTRAAWVVNRLARADPDAPSRLTGIAAALHAAAHAGDGARLRGLSARRGTLIDDLTAQALHAAGVANPPAGLREDVAATLTAALADPEVAAQFASGTLTRAAQWAGFGPAPGAEFPPASSADDAAHEPVPAARPRPASPRRAPDRKREQIAGEERAAQLRKSIEDAERAVASATEAATAAVAAEDRLEVTVRDLEQRLTQARGDLADARLRARRTEAAERKASQALARLRRLRMGKGSGRVTGGQGFRPGYGWAVVTPADLRRAVFCSSRAA
jgi:hypothetical protein